MPIRCLSRSSPVTRHSPSWPPNGVCGNCWADAKRRSPPHRSTSKPCWKVQAGVRIEIIAGLIPRFSVQACAVIREGRLTLLVDRIVADSRPLASYRELLARCFAPAALWVSPENPPCDGWFLVCSRTKTGPNCCATANGSPSSMLLPAGPVLAAAETAYREVVEQQGWVETDTAARAVRNRLAEQFAVPPLLVHTRLIRWPCHVYGRIAQALAAEEFTLPPVDWFEEEPAADEAGDAV